MSKLKSGWNFLLHHKISVLLVLTLAATFYWFQLRPAEIRKDCSWTQKHMDAVPELTQDQIDQQKTKLKQTIYGNLIPYDYPILPHPAEPAKNYYVAASPTQYSFCLHSHGL